MADEQQQLRRMRSLGVRRVMAGLRAVADANGIQQDGRIVQLGTPEQPLAVVLAVAPGHPGEKLYQAALGAAQE